MYTIIAIVLTVFIIYHAYVSYEKAALTVDHAEDVVEEKGVGSYPNHLVEEDEGGDTLIHTLHVDPPAHSYTYYVDIEDLILEVVAATPEEAIQQAVFGINPRMLYAHLDNPSIFWVEVIRKDRDGLAMYTMTRYRVFASESDDSFIILESKRR